MGLTLVEKIISEHAGKQVHAGELVISKVDVSAVQDGTGPLTVQEFKKLGKSKATEEVTEEALITIYGRSLNQNEKLGVDDNETTK